MNNIEVKQHGQEWRLVVFGNEVESFSTEREAVEAAREEAELRKEALAIVPLEGTVRLDTSYISF
jgi:hypothetical protein